MVGSSRATEILPEEDPSRGKRPAEGGDPPRQPGSGLAQTRQYSRASGIVKTPTSDCYTHFVIVTSGTDKIATLMTAFRAGDPRAGARLTELFYPELKKLAVAKLRGEREGHSWQPTLLVNELYLEILKVKGLPPAESEKQDDRAAFLGLAGHMMKRLLIHHSRPLAAKAQKVPVWDDVRAVDERSLAEVESVLATLGSIKPILRTVVEMKVFEGRTSEEIAGELHCSAVTIHRHWQFARRWLQEEWTPSSE